MIRNNVSLFQPAFPVMDHGSSGGMIFPAENGNAGRTNYLLLAAAFSKYNYPKIFLLNYPDPGMAGFADRQAGVHDFKNSTIMKSRSNAGEAGMRSYKKKDCVDA